MKSEICELFHEVAIEGGELYSTLFGSEETEVHSQISINWILNKKEIKESIEIIMDHIISQVLQSYSANEYNPKKYMFEGKYKMVLLEDGPIVNRFLPLNYQITNSSIKFADLENYIDDIEVTENDYHIYLKWKFPIYNIPKETLNTF